MKQIFLYVYRPLEIFFREVSVEIFCSLKKILLSFSSWSIGALYILCTQILFWIYRLKYIPFCAFFFFTLLITSFDKPKFLILMLSKYIDCYG